MDKRRILKIVGLLLFIFVGGAAAGILLDRHFAPRPLTPQQRMAGLPPADRPEYLLKEFTTSMHLTPDQQKRVGALLKDWGKEIGAHPEWTRAQRASFIESNRFLITTNLTAEQSVIYDRVLERMRRRHLR
jgi:hypothetical protein